MNRLFIIGNGFDLAHGLPTSYNHFINDFWGNLQNTFHKDVHKEILFIDESYLGIFDYIEPTTNFNNHVENLKEYAKNRNLDFNDKSYTLRDRSSSFRSFFEFKNNFFLLINKNQSIDSWVDIEDLYYSELKKIVKSESLDTRSTPEEWERVKKANVKKLNQEFHCIKLLLVEYLKRVIASYDFNYDSKRQWVKYHNILKPISILNSEKGILKEFNDFSDKNLVKSFYENQKESSEPKSISYFLSFNYTPSLSRYINSLSEEGFDIRLNQIHGKVNEDIVFGFGDESDEDYPLIENINNNEYLTFFKSFNYLENDRYNNFLNFIDSSPFQLIVMGHSLGLSDRVLLKTVVENENCKSIKTYYHQGESVDNFREIIQNLSRHFSDKSLMRKKVVNKLYCTPLPQITMPLKIKNS
ncbi:AbiH family protein [Winogradskyella ursingii]|uniref:AbiH family protein n=1 Tax=Winogradskyella ursingii TaxID=2686079 RepID=UPI0015CDDE5F|nr:AbiH family protein [Winogradskyella ursingii]